MPERRELGCRTHRPRDEARPGGRGKTGRYIASQLNGGLVDLANFVLQAELGEHNAGSAESVGFNDVAADPKKIGMDVPDSVRPAEVQNLGTVLLAPVVVQGGLAHLDIGAHGAIVDDHPLLHGLEKVSHCSEHQHCKVLASRGNCHAPGI